jgi:uncharacterized protein (TIGR02147 family)
MSLQYQDFLLEEFKSRRSRNPHYSLRAYARDLGMPASKLSQNLRGLCGISVAKAETIAVRLQMRDDERQLFLALVESQHARSRVARQQAQVALQKIRDEKLTEMCLEKFSVVRDWYHMAILEMTDIRGFKADPEWIAQRLGLSTDVVKEAVARLQQLELLKIEDGVWSQTGQDLKLSSSAPSRTIREHHKQIITKAIVAIDQVQMDRREYSTQTVAIDAGAVPEIKQLIQEFQHKVCKLSKRGNMNSVYVLSVQLFPLVEEAT